MVVPPPKNSIRARTHRQVKLLVIDRDYFTIAVDEILKIRPLLTAVGGKTVALNGSVASEWGGVSVQL